MHDHPTLALIRRLILIFAAAGVLAMAIAARADTIRIHRGITAVGPRIELREIAELTGPLAEQVGGTVVGEFSNGRAQVRISLESVRRSLTEAGVNWAGLSLSGYTACEVHRAGDVASPPAADPVELAAPNVESEITVDAAGSLKSLVLDKLAQYAGADLADLRVTFRDRDEAALMRGAMVERWEIEPTSSAPLGRIPLTIRRYRDGAVVETLSVTADVSKRAMALVATRTISRGEPFAAGSVELREVYLDEDRGRPIGDADLVHGQTAATLLRPGHVLYPTDVESPVLVRRGELVTVRCVSGLLVVRTVGRASQDGRLGDAIQVRNESTRQNYLATVTGAREVSARLDRTDREQAPAAAAANADAIDARG